MVFFKKPLTILILITLIGAILRFYRLSSLPPSLNWDEVSHAYNAYSLYRTGKDQWGQILPIINFRAYGDYPTPLNLYFTIPSIAIFKTTNLAARFPHALIGTLLIPTVFIAAYRWRKNYLLAVLASIFTCLDPWILFTSRTVLQSNWAVFLLALALCFYFAQKFRPAILIWGLSLFAYHNTRIFVPMLLLALAVFSRKHLVLISTVILLAVFILFSPASRVRGLWVGLINPGTVATIEYQRNHTSLPSFLARLVYNRPVFLFTHLNSNYLGYFSPQFLAISGGTQYQYSLPKTGLTSLASLPFFYLGLILLIPLSPLLLIWILLAPLPAAITQDQFAVVRATTMLPLVQMISAFGVTWFFSRIPTHFHSIILRLFLLLIVINSGLYLYKYSTIYSQQYSSSWQYGYQQVVEYIKQNYDSYDQIIFTKKYGEPHEFLAYYWPWNSASFQNNKDWDYHANWYWVNGLDKIKFVDDWEMKSVVLKSKTLTISSPENDTSGREVERINFLDGKTAFIIRAQ